MCILCPGGMSGMDMFARAHDPIGYISPERAQAALSNMPVPVGMFMNMAHVPPRFYNQHQQAMQARQNQRGRGPLPNGRAPPKTKGRPGKAGLSQGAVSQDNTQPYSQGIPLTQGMSQVIKVCFFSPLFQMKIIL